ncbi:DUF2470 domain-containing protein [Streptomyces sp. NPDC101132]|uniref:DUF2470 domain-containing protein n=1 Tax=Streptomyces sp. NPDC101132 TaxID=3366110 RepID=UPI003822964B
MGAHDVLVAGPTSAQRARTVLAAADSLTVVTGSHDCDLVGGGLHGVADDGRVLLRVPADCRLAAEVALAPRGSLSALLKFTDVAPVAVRDRVRARVTLAGWLTATGRTFDDGAHAELRLDAAHVDLDTGDGPAALGLDAFALARPDDLAAYEAGMLTHLVDGHGGVVASLARLADPRLTRDAERVTPLSLDRGGLTLRIEHAAARYDVRLPFAAPARGPEEVGERVQELLARARGCRRRASGHP